MNRRRRSPWIHRWSRPLIGGIAVLGATNTLYLTLTKYLGADTTCPTSRCEQVLSSAYAEVFGQPLALFGLIAYVVMALLALGPLIIKPDDQKELRMQWENWTWLLLFLGATAMMIFSFYLMFIMATQFVIPNGLKAMCFYCVASALFATSMFILTVIGRSWNDAGQLFFSGIIVGFLTIIATLILYAPIGQPVPDAYNITDATGTVAFSVTEKSSEADIELAKHLKQTGAVMYGAYWCPHCYDQKELFGVAASLELPYVECDPKGKSPKADLCQQKFATAEKQLKTRVGYPTWEINGTFYSGAQPLADLAKYSDYKGPKNF